MDSVRNEIIAVAMSGGVDSSVAAALLHQAIGNRLTCVFVDNGLLRQEEAEKVRSLFKQHLHMNVRFARAKSQFLDGPEGHNGPRKEAQDHRTDLHRGLRQRSPEDP